MPSRSIWLLPGVRVPHDKYTIICYPQSTDPFPCGTPPDSGGEFLVCSCYLYSVIFALFNRCLTCARHGKYTIICYPQSTDPLSCGTPPDSGGEFLVCSCTTCDLSLLVLSKLFFVSSYFFLPPFCRTKRSKKARHPGRSSCSLLLLVNCYAI